MFCHLAVKSYFSLLEGLNSPGELIEAAAACGMPALGLVDRHLLTGAVDFWLAGRKAGVRPILGLEVDVSDRGKVYRLVVYAAGPLGWGNLCRLSSAAMLQEQDGSPISKEFLADNGADLVAVCIDSPPRLQWMQGIKELFRDRVYAALCVSVPADMDRARQVSSMAEQVGLPTVAVHPVYYLRPEQATLQRAVTAIRLNKMIGSVSPEFTAPPSAHFISDIEMRNRYADFPGAMERTHEVAARCQVDLPIGQSHYPQVLLPSGMTSLTYLRNLAEEGARKIYGSITPMILSRLDHELETIGQRGYEPIFLIVKDLLDFARQNDIPTASRGSASSSLVAHCLGITTPDPLEHNLYFERFLNPAREKPPDIDTDICSRGRDRVIAHAFEHYGAERVAMVSTINRFRPKSALGDLAKAHGLEPGLVRELSAMLPHAFWSSREGEGRDGEGRSPFAAASVVYPKLKNLFQDAQSLLSLPRHLSVHPGGLVVSPGQMTERVAVMRSGTKGVVITQLDLNGVEALGLVKIDLLGIRGLTVMGDVAHAIHSWRRKEFKTSLDVLEQIPDDDKFTADCVENGRTIGCFQIESPGMRSVLREIRARTPNDILAALALYRPGPLQGGLKDAFVRRFKGLEKVNHLHPSLEPLLSDTYGVILYQEQVLRIANTLAGFNLAEADLLRRAMSHFDPGRQMQELKEKFIQGAQERAGVPTETAARIWEMMAAFAGYGFPKAHAASYALVAWRSAWCKTHFPAEFLSAVLANWGGYYSQRVYLGEARRLGLQIQPPNINHADRQFSVAYPGGEPVLFMGMEQVRDLSSRTQEAILAKRPFYTLEGFLSRVNPRKKEVENLALCGALSDFGHTPDLLARISTGGWRAGQPGLFEPLPGGHCGEDWSIEQKCQAQEEVLGIAIDAHPLDLVKARVLQTGAISTIEAVGRIGESVLVAGVRMTSHRTRTANGENMLFLTLEDKEGLLDVIVLPNVYRRDRLALTTGKPILVRGVVQLDEERGEPVLRAEWVEGF